MTDLNGGGPDARLDHLEGRVLALEGDDARARRDMARIEAKADATITDIRELRVEQHRQGLLLNEVARVVGVPGERLEALTWHDEDSIVRRVGKLQEEAARAKAEQLARERAAAPPTTSMRPHGAAQWGKFIGAATVALLALAALLKALADAVSGGSP